MNNHMTNPPRSNGDKRAFSVSGMCRGSEKWFRRSAGHPRRQPPGRFGQLVSPDRRDVRSVRSRPGDIGAKLAHGDEDVVDLRDGFVSRHAVRRIIAGELDRALTRMRIGAILCPTVLFAFVNGTCLQQQVDSPSAQRPDRGASFLGHRHREHSCRTDPSALPLVPSG